MSKPVVLLFGLPRSGTTWIGKIFDSHPITLYRHEPDSWRRITSIPLLANVDNQGDYCQFLKEYVDGFEDISLPQVTAKRPYFDKEYSSWLRQGLFRASATSSAIAGKLSRKLTMPTISPVSIGRSDNLVLIWKSIESLGRLGVISRCVCQCKAIHILRHPCGYIASVLGGEASSKFVSSVPSSEDYDLFGRLMETEQAQGYGLSLSQIKEMKPVERLAWRWVLFNEKAMSDMEGHANYKWMRYEDMCTDPIGEAKKYFSFAGLSWNDQTENFLQASTSKESTAYYSVYKNPEKSANKWKEKLSSDDINAIRSIVVETKPGKLYLDMFPS